MGSHDTIMIVIDIILAPLNINWDDVHNIANTASTKITCHMLMTVYVYFYICDNTVS